jgi:copper homeostasis protein
MAVDILIEICANSAESARAGWQGGGDRVELCAALTEGGITPSAGELQLTRKNVDIPIFVMIRPRGGDFLYSDLEFEIMKADVAQARQGGADGIVFGILGPNGTVDGVRCRQLVDLADPLPATFHRAFDMTPDPVAALADIMAVGCERILTSGQSPDALAGIDLIARLITVAADRIIIMPGGGIALENVAEIVDRAKPHEIHLTGQVEVESGMVFRNPRVFMGIPGLPEYRRSVTSADTIRQVRERVGQR